MYLYENPHLPFSSISGEVNNERDYFVSCSGRYDYGQQRKRRPVWSVQQRRMRWLRRWLRRARMLRIQLLCSGRLLRKCLRAHLLCSGSLLRSDLLCTSWLWQRMRSDLLCSG
jgi:hypothetical protein